MPLIAKEAVEIPVGRKTGRIDKVEVTTSRNEKDENVQYLQLTVQTLPPYAKGWNGQMRLSCPFYLTKNSALGRLLTRLNIPFGVGQEFDEAVLKGLNVSFDTKREGNFTNPIMDSVLPAPSSEDSDDDDAEETEDDE